MGGLGEGGEGAGLDASESSRRALIISCAAMLGTTSVLLLAFPLLSSRPRWG